MTNAAKLQNLPAYTVAEAARYLRIPSGTLQAWLHGRTYNTKHTLRANSDRQF